MRVAQFAAVVLAGIVFTGSAVRLTQSGLGCEDWPRCSADRFVPEASLHPWIEFGNRLLSGVVSGAVIAAVLTAYRRSPRRSDLIRWSWGLVLGVLAQIVLGGITVLVDLHPLVVAAHFLLSAVLMWNVLVLISRAMTPPLESPAPTADHQVSDDGVLWHSRFTVATALLVLVAGTLVSGSGPHGGDTRAARLGFDLVAITRVHSAAAWLLVAATVSLAIRFRRRSLPVPRPLTWLLGAILVQGGVGYWQYATGVPAGLVELHVIGAIAVWCAAVWLHLGLGGRAVPSQARLC